MYRKPVGGEEKLSCVNKIKNVLFLSFCWILGSYELINLTAKSSYGPDAACWINWYKQVLVVLSHYHNWLSTIELNLI